MDQLTAVRTKSGPLGMSERLGGPQRGLLGPKRALSSCWMALYGLIGWFMIRAYRCVALDTPLAYIREKNTGTPHWATKGIGSNGAFWGPWPLKKGPTSGQSCGNRESNLVGPIDSSSDQIGPPGDVRAPRGPPKGSPGAKTGPFLLPDGSIWTDTVVYDCLLYTSPSPRDRG